MLPQDDNGMLEQISFPNDYNMKTTLTIFSKNN